MIWSLDRSGFIALVASHEKSEAVVRSLSSKGVRSIAIRADQSEPSQADVLVKQVVEIAISPGFFDR